MALEFFINHNLAGINERYFVVRGRNILSSKYRQVKESLVSQFVCFDPIDKPSGPYGVYIESYMYNDIDSFVKIILDALQAAEVIDNDSNIVSLTVRKHKIGRGEPQEHFVRVYHYDN